MGSGEMEIKKIEDSTRRQVTYSKRRNGILKKAHELTVLCDAKVSLIMYSSTKKLHEYTSPTTTVKKIIDQYQRTLDIDLWSTHYEKMQENLRRLKDMNNTLRRNIMQRMGEELNDLNMEQLCSLEENMLESLENIRHRKYHVIRTQTDTYRKKVRSLQSIQENLRYDLEVKYEHPHGIVENEGDYNSAAAFANEVPNLSAIQQHQSYLNLHVDGNFESPE
ncbi:hypothetical protein Pfo_007687 [Paulownia fortunei]|nr:hypothetical protein Pfo_007687 [Paulownia fortunei]